MRLERGVGQSNIVRCVLVDELLQLGLRFGESLDLGAVALVDLLHALQTGRLSDRQCMDMFSAALHHRREPLELFSQTID